MWILMDNQKIFSATGRRIEVIDALRGFALLGVLLTHMISHFGYYLFDGVERVPWLSGLDGFVGWLNANVLTGRFVNIFAFLLKGNILKTIIDANFIQVTGFFEHTPRFFTRNMYKS